MLSIRSIVIRVDDLERQTQFWQQALGYERRAEKSETFAHLYPKDGVGPDIALDALPSEVRVPPRIHIDFHTDDPETEIRRLISLGASEIPWENRPPEADYVVMADPEGNRFCVVGAQPEAVVGRGFDRRAETVI